MTCLISKQIVQIASGDFHNLIVEKEGGVKSFGWNFYGQLGLNDQKNRLIPTEIEEIENVIQVACGIGFSLFLNRLGSIYSCGKNNV